MEVEVQTTEYDKEIIPQQVGELEDLKKKLLEIEDELDKKDEIIKACSDYIISLMEHTDNVIEDKTDEMNETLEKNLLQYKKDKENRENLHQTALNDAELQQKNMAANVNKLERLNSDKDAEIDALNKENSDKAMEIDVLKKENSDKNEEIDVLTRENSNKDEEIDALNKENSDKDEKIDVLTRENSDKDEEIDILKKENSERDEEIDVLKKENSDRDGEIDVLKKENSEKDAEINKLKKENSDKDAEIDVLNNEVENLKSKTSVLNTKLMEKADMLLRIFENTNMLKEKLAPHRVLCFLKQSNRKKEALDMIHDIEGLISLKTALRHSQTL